MTVEQKLRASIGQLQLIVDMGSRCSSIREDQMGENPLEMETFHEIQKKAHDNLIEVLNHIGSTRLEEISKILKEYFNG